MLKFLKFRGIESGRWKEGGIWQEGKHFHLGRGPGLQEHHLPQQASNWFKNWLNNIQKGRGWF